MTTTHTTPARRIENIALWILQGALAALFVFAGAMKFVMSVEEMTRDIALPGWFLHFIGVAELLGGLGLVLPGIFRVRRELTPWAAAGLLVIMLGASVLTTMTGGLSAALMPAFIALACAYIAQRRAAQLRAAGALHSLVHA